MIAVYLRLSMADGDLGVDGKDESNSIDNQRSIINDYINRKGDLDGEVIEYIDDGFSGTNFNRPAFTKLLEDMKAGKVNVVITKDLSRLGRNYIEVGDYMEQIFPTLGVRYMRRSGKAAFLLPVVLRLVISEILITKGNG